MTLPTTALLAALLGVLALALTIYVSAQRLRVGKAAGEITAAAFGPHPDMGLTAAIRAHGNFMEYTPFVLIMIGLAELNGAASVWLLPLGLAFVVGRYLHAFAMLTNPFPPALRGIAMFATYAAMIVPVIYLGLQLI